MFAFYSLPLLCHADVNGSVSAFQAESLSSNLKNGFAKRERYYMFLWPCGEMANTADLKSAACNGLVGSSPSKAIFS